MNFADARILDVKWWRNTNAVLSAMAQQDEIQGLRAIFDFQRALVSNSGITEQSFKQAQERSMEIFQSMLGEISPWTRDNKGSVKQKQIVGMIERYKQVFGDPNDPVFIERLKKELEESEKAEAIVPVETDDERITRLIAERDEYYRQKGLIAQKSRDANARKYASSAGRR